MEYLLSTLKISLVIFAFALMFFQISTYVLTTIGLKPNSKISLFFCVKNRWKFLIPFYSLFINFFGLNDKLFKIFSNITTIIAFVSIGLRGIYAMCYHTKLVLTKEIMILIIVIALILFINGCFRLCVSLSIFVTLEIILKNVFLKEMLNTRLNVIPFGENDISPSLETIGDKNLTTIKDNEISLQRPNFEPPHPKKSFFDILKSHLEHYKKPAIYLAATTIIVTGIIGYVAITDSREKTAWEKKQAESAAAEIKRKNDLDIAETRRKNDLDIAETRRRNDLRERKVLAIEKNNEILKQQKGKSWYNVFSKDGSYFEKDEKSSSSSGFKSK